MNKEEIRKRLAALADRMDELSAQDTLSEDEQAEFDTADAEFDKLEAQLKRMEKAEARNRTLDEPRPRQAVPQPSQADSRVEITHEDAFANRGEFLNAVRMACTNQGSQDTIARLHNYNSELMAANGMNETSDPEGGFLVGYDWTSDIKQRMFSTGEILSRVARQPIGPNSDALAYPYLDEESRAASTRHGGIRVYYTGEADTIASSKAKFKQGRIPLDKSTALIPVTSELLRDTTALSAWIDREVPTALQWAAENKVINGSGVAQPLGIINSGALVTVAKEGGQTADTVVAENIFKMYARQINVSRAVWLISQNVWPQIFQLHIAVGTGGAPIFVPGGNISGAPFGTLLGRPIIPVEYCSTLGDVGDIIFADLGSYLLPEKGGIDQQTSIHVFFATDETAFRFTWRHNGQPIFNTAITPANNGDTLSEFVALAARA